MNENNLRNLLKEISDKHQFSHILVAGDFNYSDINWNNWSTGKDNSELFLECLRDCFWFQHVHEFTRYRHNQHNKQILLCMLMTQRCLKKYSLRKI